MKEKYPFLLADDTLEKCKEKLEKAREEKIVEGIHAKYPELNVKGFDGLQQ